MPASINGNPGVSEQRPDHCVDCAIVHRRIWDHKRHKNLLAACHFGAYFVDIVQQGFFCFGKQLTFPWLTRFLLYKVDSVIHEINVFKSQGSNITGADAISGQE